MVRMKAFDENDDKITTFLLSMVARMYRDSADSMEKILGISQKENNLIESLFGRMTGGIKIMGRT